MVEYSTNLDSETGAEMVLLLRGWNNSEAVRRREERSIRQAKDFDVAGDVSTLVSPSRAVELSRPMSRNQFTWQLTNLSNRFNPDSPEGQFGRARAEALKAYIDVFEHRVYYSLNDYLHKTLAIPPNSPVAYTPLPQEVIDRQRRKVERLFPSDQALNRDSWCRFIEAEEIPVEELEDRFLEATEKMGPNFRDLAGLDHVPEFRVVFENRPNVSWFNWTTADENGTVVKINTHEDHRRRRFRGSEEQIVSHEIGSHATEGELIRLGIKNGVVNPMFGISTVPGVEQWHNEGFGNTIDLYDDDIADNLSQHGQFAIELRRLETFVMRVAHIWINEYPEDKKNVRDYVLDQLPNYNEEVVERQLDQRLNDPESRSYLAAYGASYEHSAFAQRLLGETAPVPALPPFFRLVDRRKDLARFMMSQPRLPMQIHNKMVELDTSPVVRG